MEKIPAIGLFSSSNQSWRPNSTSTFKKNVLQQSTATSFYQPNSPNTNVISTHNSQQPFHQQQQSKHSSQFVRSGSPKKLFLQQTQPSPKQILLSTYVSNNNHRNNGNSSSSITFFNTTNNIGNTANRNRNSSLFSTNSTCYRQRPTHHHGNHPRSQSRPSNNKNYYTDAMRICEQNQRKLDSSTTNSIIQMQRQMSLKQMGLGNFVKYNHPHNRTSAQVDKFLKQRDAGFKFRLDQEMDVYRTEQIQRIIRLELEKQRLKNQKASHSPSIQYNPAPQPLVVIRPRPVQQPQPHQQIYRIPTFNMIVGKESQLVMAPAPTAPAYIPEQEGARSLKSIATNKRQSRQTIIMPEQEKQPNMQIKMLSRPQSPPKFQASPQFPHQNKPRSFNPQPAPPKQQKTRNIVTTEQQFSSSSKTSSFNPPPSKIQSKILDIQSRLPIVDELLFSDRSQQFENKHLLQDLSALKNDNLDFEKDYIRQMDKLIKDYGSIKDRDLTFSKITGNLHKKKKLQVTQLSSLGQSHVEVERERNS